MLLQMAQRNQSCKADGQWDSALNMHSQFSSSLCWSAEGQDCLRWLCGAQSSCVSWLKYSSYFWERSTLGCREKTGWSWEREQNVFLLCRRSSGRHLNLPQDGGTGHAEAWGIGLHTVRSSRGHTCRTQDTCRTLSFIFSKLGKLYKATSKGMT